MSKNKIIPLALAGLLAFSPIALPNNTANVHAANEAETTTNNDSVLLTTVTSIDDLQRKIDNDLAFSSQDIVKSHSKGKVFKVILPSDGWLILKDYGTSNLLQALELYSNFALTSKLKSVKTDETMAVYLEKGTYYYRTVNSASSVSEATHSVYAGFIPSADKISVKSIKLSKDKATATITFTTPLSYETIRTVKGDVSYKDYSSDNIWQTTNRLNCAEDLKYTVSSNGIYTSRIVPENHDVIFCYMIKYNVSGIKSGKPSTPKVTTYKRNTKVVKGKGKAYTKVFVKAGKKVYKSTVNAKGYYSVKTAKLKKGTKVSVYLQNSAGTVSKTKTVTVK